MTALRTKKDITKVVILDAKNLPGVKGRYELQLGFTALKTSSTILRGASDVIPVYGFTEIVILKQAAMDRLLEKLGLEFFYQLQEAQRFSFDNVWGTQSAVHAISLLISPECMKWQIVQLDELPKGKVYIVLSNLGVSTKVRFDKLCKPIREILIIADFGVSCVFQFFGYKSRFMTAIVGMDKLDKLHELLPKADRSGDLTDKWLLIRQQDMKKILQEVLT